MKYTVRPTARFQRDVKRMQKRGRNIELLMNVVKQLAAGIPLEKKYRDHSLEGNYIGCRECHIQPDWLLIYEIDGDSLFLYLTRTGTHSDMF